MNKLEQLRAMTDVVADTGDLAAIERLKPTDATTNPALVLKTVQQAQYQEQIATIVREYAQEDSSRLQGRIAVDLGKKILALIPGIVSTEIDARLSFDTQAMIAQADQIMDLYAQQGVDTSRVLIKMAATWEGIQAAQQLERRGIRCNLTLLFSFAQARACADAGVFLISPFVGRILDWHQAKTGKIYTGENDPGVQSVRAIYRYYKTHGYATVVMGASFRNPAQIEALAGCDKLTISPELITQLANDQGVLTRRLRAESNFQQPEPTLSESQYRWHHNQDAMAVEKLSDGIRRFADDQQTLEAMVAALRR